MKASLSINLKYGASALLEKVQGLIRDADDTMRPEIFVKRIPRDRKINYLPESAVSYTPKNFSDNTYRISYSFTSRIGDLYYIFQYESIPIDNLKIVRQRIKHWNDENHSRVTYFDSENDFFIKIWDKDYIRANNITEAINVGFYDRTVIPNFSGLIFDREKYSRGYITKTCKKDNSKYQEMFKIISDKTKRIRYFAYDFCLDHVMNFEGKPCLIDLEGVYELELYPFLKHHHETTYIGIGRYVEDLKYEILVSGFYRYVPINLHYFLNSWFPTRKCPKKAICLNNYKLKTVREVIEYWKDENKRREVEKILKPGNQEYYLNIKYGFRNGVADSGPGSILDYKITPEHFESKKPMTEQEILEFNRSHPLRRFEPHKLSHGTHRIYAMIGRLVRDESYVPFFVPKDILYCKKDCPYHHEHSIDPISNIKYLKMLNLLPRCEYTIVQSGILTLMGIRKNDDLDIIISSKLKKKLKGILVIAGKLRNNLKGIPLGIDVMIDNPKFRLYGCENDDDLVYNYSQLINGYNFAEPRFYFNRKNRKTDRDLRDWEGIEKFKEMKSYEGYPFCNFTKEQWGFD